MILLSLVNAYALDCTGLDTNACTATNMIIGEINAEFGGTIVGDTASGRFSSMNIYNKVLAIDTAVLAEGCNASSGTMGGTYSMADKTWSGTWDGVGATTGAASGQVKSRLHRWTGDFDGDTTGSTGDKFTSLQLGTHQGAFGGNWGDGFMAGYWMKVAGKTGVYYAATGTCAAPALDGWLGHPVGSPTAVDGTLTVLGTGTGALLGGDLSDPENDGLDQLGAEHDSSWNWVDAFASSEPDFQGGEYAFNVFDNQLVGGNGKWCCADVAPEGPQWVGFELASPVRLTHFTISSANDVPSRDAIWWHIEGSNDGSDWYPIFVQKDSTQIWTLRHQVVLVDLDQRAPAYRFFRYIGYQNQDGLHQLGELELFAD